MEEEEGGFWGKGGVGRRSLGLTAVTTGLKFDEPIELEEIFWRRIYECMHDIVWENNCISVRDVSKYGV